MTQEGHCVGDATEERGEGEEQRVQLLRWGSGVWAAWLVVEVGTSMRLIKKFCGYIIYSETGFAAI